MADTGSAMSGTTTLLGVFVDSLDEKCDRSTEKVVSPGYRRCLPGEA